MQKRVNVDLFHLQAYNYENIAEIKAGILHGKESRFFVTLSLIGLMHEKRNACKIY